MKCAINGSKLGAKRGVFLLKLVNKAKYLYEDGELWRKCKMSLNLELKVGHVLLEMRLYYTSFSEFGCELLASFRLANH